MSQSHSLIVKATCFVVAATFVLSASQSASAVPIAGGDAIKLDLSRAGDGDGGSLADWNQVSTNFNNSGIAAGSVIRHGDGAVVDGVAISFSNLINNNFNNDGNSANWGGTGADPYYILGADDIYFHGSAADFSVTFSDLDPNLTYNARIYSLIGNSANSVERFVVTDGLGTQMVQNTRSTRFGAATLEDAGTVFSGLSLNANNELIVTVEDVSSPFYPFNALVIEAVAGPVPEPTTALLLATGAMGLARRRRRIA